MLLKALVFALMTFGIAMVVAFLVAAVIKMISAFVQREKKPAANSESK